MFEGRAVRGRSNGVSSLSETQAAHAKQIQIPSVQWQELCSLWLCSSPLVVAHGRQAALFQ